MYLKDDDRDWEEREADIVLMYLQSIHSQIVQRLRPCVFVPDLQNFNTCSNLTS